MAAFGTWGRVVLVCGGREVGAWLAVGEGPPDLAVVEALARMQLAARRLGGQIQVRDVSTELKELLDLAGLGGQVGGEPERREEVGVEEGVEPGDPVA